MASAEAKMRKQRCGNCFDCPSCGHTLSTRATAVVHAKPDDPGKTTAQKAYYLACGFCRWSTRDSGIPDQQQPAGGWQEKANQHFKRVSELIDSYHHLAIREKADQEWSKFVRKRNYMILLERYPVLNPRLRRFCSSSWTAPNRETEPTKKVVLPSAEPSLELSNFDVDSFVKQPLCIDKITTIHQRHLAPQFQPKSTYELEPRPKSLVVKRSMRCRVCEHNLSKADFNPSSIKFRINLSALYHVPEVRYMLIPETDVEKASNVPQPKRRMSCTFASMRTEKLIHYDVKFGQTMNIVLTISNPAHRVTTISLRQLTAEEELESLQHLTNHPTSATNLTLLHEKTPQETQNVNKFASSCVPCYSTVKLDLPSVEFQLAPRNDISEYEDSLSFGALGDRKKESKLVAFRRGNKIGVLVGLTPLPTIKPVHGVSLAPVPENEGSSQEPLTLAPLQAAIYLNFDYKNATTSLLSEQQKAAAAAATPQNKSQIEQTSLLSQSKPADLSNTSASSVDEINHIKVIVLLNFGDMVVRS